MTTAPVKCRSLWAKSSEQSLKALAAAACILTFVKILVKSLCIGHPTYTGNTHMQTLGSVQVDAN